MYCRKCGTKISDDSVFCIKCGASQTADNMEKTSDEAKIATQQAVTLRIPFLLISFIFVFSPFYKMLSVPIGDLFIGIVSSFSGYSTDANTSFSLVSFFSFLGKLGDDAEKLDWFWLLFYIYGFFWVISVGGILMMVQKYAQGITRTYGFWQGASSSFLTILMANLSLGVFCYILNTTWNDQTNEYLGTDMSVKFVELSKVYYLLIIGSLICFLISNSQKAAVPNNEKKEPKDYLKESQFTVVNRINEKKYIKERAEIAAAQTAENVLERTGKWICPNCEQLNDNSKRICSGCGEYK